MLKSELNIKGSGKLMPSLFPSVLKNIYLFLVLGSKEKSRGSIVEGSF